MPAIQWRWLEGPDYLLLYVISNELTEVTTVYIDVPQGLPEGLEVFDMTDFVRSRNWQPVAWRRHLEMFPGQGQIMLVAERHVCEGLRDTVSSRLRDDDRRQIALDLGLARRHNLDTKAVQRSLHQIGTGAPLEDSLKTLEAREQLINSIYRAPKLAEARSSLTKAGAAICACDGALCRLLGTGQVDAAFEMGVSVLPLARKIAGLRLKVRRNHDDDLIEQAEDLTRQSLKLMERIRKVR
jgi:hypothetical protein